MTDQAKKLRRHWLLSLALGAIFISSTARAASPVVKLSRDAVTITGISPGATLALLSVAKEPVGVPPQPNYYMARRVSRHELLVDDDRDGQVRYTPSKGVTFSSIWVVVDTATGEFATAWPEGFRALEMHQRGAGRGKAVEAIANTLDIGRERVDVLVVRPGMGAWICTAREGSDTDTDDKKDRRVRLDLSKLRPLGTSTEEAPRALRKGDVVAVLDSALMQYWARRIE